MFNKLPYYEINISNIYLGFPGSLAGKESACNAGDMGSIPGLGTATHSSILAWRIPIDRGAWQVTIHGFPKSQTCLTFTQFTSRLH